MGLSTGDIATLIVALTGVGGLYPSYRLGQRGHENDKKQQAAATTLQERIAAFDELESLNDRLEKENLRLRALVDEAEARGDLRLAAQGRRCRERLDDLTTAMSTLQSVVLAEMAQKSAGEAVDRAREHITTDHPDAD